MPHGSLDPATFVEVMASLSLSAHEGSAIPVTRHFFTGYGGVPVQAPEQPGPRQIAASEAAAEGNAIPPQVQDSEHPPGSVRSQCCTGGCDGGMNPAGAKRRLGILLPTRRVVRWPDRVCWPLSASRGSSGPPLHLDRSRAPQTVSCGHERPRHRPRRTAVYANTRRERRRRRNRSGSRARLAEREVARPRRDSGARAGDAPPLDSGPARPQPRRPVRNA